jgi:lactate dehydrogenase-like 2-hydroxyacid dehydrogenase
MARPVLLITRRMPPAIEARAAGNYDLRLSGADRPLADAELLALAADANAILCCPSDSMDATLLRALPASVRVIGTFSISTDHIDLNAARARGIAVVNTPDVVSMAAAEVAFLLMLAAAHRLGEGERLVRSGQWAGWAPTQLLGTLVSGKRLGILGMGRVGRELARMAKALTMPVHYRDLVRLPPEAEAGAIWHADDASFLAVCDVLSLHAPGGRATRKWLNAERIAALPRGAIVVNAARGTLIDDEALIAALRTGQVGAAGLDVYDGEPSVHPGYRALEHVVLLPNLGSATTETRDAMGHIVLDGIDALLAGHAPANLVR